MSHITSTQSIAATNNKLPLTLTRRCVDGKKSKLVKNAVLVFNAPKTMTTLRAVAQLRLLGIEFRDYQEFSGKKSREIKFFGCRYEIELPEYLKISTDY